MYCNFYILGNVGWITDQGTNEDDGISDPDYVRSLLADIPGASLDDPLIQVREFLCSQINLSYSNLVRVKTVLMMSCANHVFYRLLLGNTSKLSQKRLERKTAMKSKMIKNRLIYYLHTTDMHLANECNPQESVAYYH